MVRTIKTPIPFVDPRIKELLDAAKEIIGKGYIANVEEFTHPLIGRVFQGVDGRITKIISTTLETIDCLDGWPGKELDRRTINRWLFEEGIANGSIKEQN